MQVGKTKCCQIFFSFLSLFKKLNFSDLTSPKINTYQVTFSDEKSLIDKCYNVEFIKRIQELLKIYDENKFNFQELNKCNTLLEEILGFIEANYPQCLYINTKNFLISELDECKYFFFT